MLSDGRRCDEELDNFALLASQDYNLGNAGNWFFSFRGGLYGFHSRMNGLEQHRRLVYEWHTAALLDMHEHNIATMLFCMDSAIECIVFALNALGQAKDRASFRDVTDSAALRNISPRDVTGSPSSRPLPGYLSLFPTFQAHFVANSDLITLIMDNHDVSKHRQQIIYTGIMRSDVPPGFFELRGIPDGRIARHFLKPMSEVRILLHPKIPIEVMPNNLEAQTRLDTVIADLRAFLNEAICLAYNDAVKNIQLPIAALRKP